MDTTNVTACDNGVVIHHSGRSELHLHLTFTVVAATDAELAQIGTIQARLKTSADELSAATAAAV